MSFTVTGKKTEHSQILTTFFYTRIHDVWPKRVGAFGKAVVAEPLPGVVKVGQPLTVFPSRDRFMTFKFFACPSDTLTITMEPKGVKLTATGEGCKVLEHLVHLPVIKTGFSVSKDSA